jgi:hypothetical protein
MIYLSWAALYEGATDTSYLGVLLPRIMEAISLADGRQEIRVPPDAVYGTGLPREMQSFAEAACSLKDSVHIIFVHADTGGRALEANMGSRSCAYCDAIRDFCEWPPERCVVVAPRHEMEAWALADPAAVCDALGYAGHPADLDLPQDAVAAEGLADPKATLEAALAEVRGRRSRQPAHQILPAIARDQSIDALRRSPSFRDFEQDLRGAMASLGCIDPT